MGRILEHLEALLELLLLAPDPTRTVADLVDLAANKDSAGILAMLPASPLAAAALLRAGVIGESGALVLTARETLLRTQGIVAERLKPHDTWHEVATVPAYLRPHVDLRTFTETLPSLLELVAKARSQLIIASPFLDTGFGHLLPRLQTFSAQGGSLLVITRELTRNDSRNSTIVRELRRICAKGKLAVASWEDEGLGLHIKALVADGRRAYVGSANFTWGGIGQQAELGVLLEGPSVSRIAIYLQELADALRSRRRFQAP